MKFILIYSFGVKYISFTKIPRNTILAVHHNIYSDSLCLSLSANNISLAVEILHISVREIFV